MTKQASAKPETKMTGSQKGCAWFFMAVIVVGIVWSVLADVVPASDPDPGSFTNDDTSVFSPTMKYNGGSVPTFTPDSAQQLTTSLAELEKAYGVCFGWSLTDGSSKRVQTGSSRGLDVPAKNCGRWLEVQVAVGYTSDSSESLDGANIAVEGSADFRRGTFPRNEDFARLGVHAPALVEDPVAGTGHAALGLPLLMVESGGLQAVQTPPPAGQPAPAKPLGPPGSSDFPLSTTLLLSGLGMGVLICVLLGFWMRARAKKKEAPAPPAPPVRPSRPPVPPPQQQHSGPVQPGQQGGWTPPPQQAPGQPPYPGHRQQPGPQQHPGNPGNPQWPGQQPRG